MANILESRTSYKTLFNDNQDLYCLPGLPETNDGPLAYLVDLYQQTRLFESEADKDSVRFLSQRCPDIETLLLDSTNLNKTSSLLPLIIEALAQKVKAHINKNQPLTNSLAEIHYPLALPFHFPLKQTIAVLAEKELPLLELIQQADRQYPNFIDNNLSSDSLQTAMMVSSSLAPKLQTLLQEKSQSDQKDFFAKYYGVKGDAAEAALSLSRLTVFTQQTNLSSQEAERLFAINGLSDNKITHSIVTYSSNVAKPTNAGKQFPSGANYAASFINAGTEPAIYLAKTVDPKTAKDVVLLKEISNDNFDRIQRFLHIQKALKLTSEQLDLLLVTARQAEKQQDFAITEATLRALGVFLHFQQEYSTTAEQFAAFIGQITPYSLENKLSFFDRLFNASGLSQQAASSSVLVLDNQEFDPSTIEGLDALTVNQLCAGLKIDDATCQILLSLIMQAQTLTKPKRSLDVVSALYRLVELPRLLKLPVKEGLGLLLLLNNDNPNYLQQLAGVPVLSKNAEDIDILDVMVGVMNAAQWIKRHELSTLSLNLLLTPYQPDANGVTSEDIENIDWLKKVISILPDQQYALLSEDKIAAAMMGFQAKQIPVNWMKSFSELVDENMGIIQGDLDGVVMR
uniref:Tc toxin subunit A n=1 Tax=Xenorhabdus bovienii TaxID=40576 RepID=UPI001EDF391E